MATTVTATLAREDHDTLPEGWQQVPVEYLTEKTQQCNPQNRPSEVFKYVDVSGVSRERLAITNWSEVQGPCAPSRARKLVRTGDVIFATVRPTLRRIAKIPPPLDGQLCSTAFCVLRADLSKVDPDFLYHAVSTSDFVSVVSAHQRGSGYPAVTDTQGRAGSIPLPPLPEQRRIARVLNAIQRAIEAQAKVIATAHELKRSLMRHLFTYGPVPVSEAARISLKETEIGPVPEHWSIQRISALCTHIVDCPHSTPTWTEAGALAIRNVNIKDGQLVPPRYFVSQDEYAARIRRLEPRPGDVLLSREAPIGEACLVPSRTQLCLGQRIMLMRTNGRLLVNSFLVYSFYSPRIRSLLESIGKGVTAKHINVADVKDLRIAIPPQTEQLRIVAVLLATDAKLSHEVERQQALSALFSSALHHLMTGKLRVPESLEA